MGLGFVEQGGADGAGVVQLGRALGVLVGEGSLGGQGPFGCPGSGDLGDGDTNLALCTGLSCRGCGDSGFCSPNFRVGGFEHGGLFDAVETCHDLVLLDAFTFLHGDLGEPPTGPAADEALHALDDGRASGRSMFVGTFRGHSPCERA